MWLFWMVWVCEKFFYAHTCEKFVVSNFAECAYVSKCIGDDVWFTRIFLFAALTFLHSFFLFWMAWFNMYVWMVIWFCMTLTLTHLPCCTWIAFSELRHVVFMYADHLRWLSWPILMVLFLWCFVLGAYDNGYDMENIGYTWLEKAWNVYYWSCKEFGLLQLGSHKWSSLHFFLYLVFVLMYIDAQGVHM